MTFQKYSAHYHYLQTPCLNWNIWGHFSCLIVIWFPLTKSSPFFIPYTSQSLLTTILLPSSTRSTFLDSTYTWDHVGLSVLGLFNLLQCPLFPSIFSHRTRNHVLDGVVSHCVYIIHFLCLLISWSIPSWSLFFPIPNKAARMSFFFHFF